MDELDMSMSGSPQTSLILGREVITWWKSGVMYMVRLRGKRVLIISIVECVPRADGAITKKATRGNIEVTLHHRVAE